MILPKGKNILGIFAHPDDDAFGPAGTIIKLSKENHFYEVFVTNGQAGTNQLTGKKDVKLGEIRKNEALSSAKILGVKKVFFLNFQDGKLCNRLYHQVASLIQDIIKRYKIQVLFTYETRGVSGHIDHIFTSLVTTFLAEKLSLPCWYYCLTREQRRFIQDYFVFFPPGYKKKQIDLLVDISDVTDLKVKAIKCHRSQLKDSEVILKNIKKPVNLTEGFFITSKFSKFSLA